MTREAPRAAGVRDIAVVAFAQTDHRRTSEEVSEVEMLMPVLHEVMESTGLKTADIGFTCSGSSDYLMRPRLLLHPRPRRRGRLAADLRVARRDGRGLGAVRGLGETADGGRRHRARLLVRQVLARVGAGRHDPAVGPVLRGSAVARLRRPRRPPGPGAHRRGHRGRAGDWRPSGRAAARTPPPTPTPSCGVRCPRGTISYGRCARGTVRPSVTGPPPWSSRRGNGPVTCASDPRGSGASTTASRRTASAYAI